MGFSLKGWASHALKLPKSVRKINVGKEVRRAITGAVSNFEEQVSASGATAGQAVANVNRAAITTQYLPWIIGGAALVIIFVVMRRR